jgi:tetraacyldisaccharide 4'-kinase
LAPWDHRTLSALLRPASALFGAAVRARNALFDASVLRRRSAPVPVVSVGNLSAGGTGKTPLVETLARFFADEGFRPAVVSRGYGRKSRGPVVVSDGRTVEPDPERTGDEPLLLARRLPGVPVIAAEDRALGARLAAGAYGCTLVLLDDGFQHRGLRRDADVVVLRRDRPLGNGRLLPAGPLREPVSALGRAHLVAWTGAGAEPDLARGRAAIRTRIEPVGWIGHVFPVPESGRGPELPTDAFRHRFVFSFSGIGNPDSFARTLAGMEIESAGTAVFPDHHRYSERDLVRLAERSETRGAVAVVTTEKDLVRIVRPWPGVLPLYGLRIRTEVEGGAGALREAFFGGESPLLRRPAAP